MQVKFFLKNKIRYLPKGSGVYFFSNEKNILYIGKASNLKERVKNHFQQPSYKDNLFINKINKIGYIKTGSEIKALILEANLIKKYQPKYNIMWRDDKNYFYAAITKEDYPRVLITHQIKESAEYVGPFVEGNFLKKALRILRGIFPYYTLKKHPPKACLWCHLNLCPGPNPDKKEYKKNINNLVKVLQGKNKKVLKNLKKEMKAASKMDDFEKAAKIRDQIKALERVFAHYKIFEQLSPLQNDSWIKIQNDLRKILNFKNGIKRIEAYDISDIKGQFATGSMVAFINGRPNKNFYRKFKIRLLKKPNDVGMIKEVLDRRLKHNEWELPNLILIDGGKAQLNAALNSKYQNQNTKDIKIIALAKRKNKLYLENRKKPIQLNSLPQPLKFIILQLRDEAHRFAIAYHKKLRQGFLLQN